MISSIFGLCFAFRPVRGASGKTREGFGWPTRSRALAFTAFAAENPVFFRFAMAKTSMPQKAPMRQIYSRFCCRLPQLPDRRHIYSPAPSARQWISGRAAMEEREFFNESTEQRSHNLTCPKCGQAADYKVTWVVRRKRAQLPRGADERDRARFAKAQSYMVRRDDKLQCSNIRCRKPFEITSLQSLAFLMD
jgi:hypothetical protein